MWHKLKPHRPRLLPVAMKSLTLRRGSLSPPATPAVTLNHQNGTSIQIMMPWLMGNAREVKPVPTAVSVSMGSEIVTAISLGLVASSAVASVPSAEATPEAAGATWFFAIVGFSSFLQEIFAKIFSTLQNSQ